MRATDKRVTVHCECGQVWDLVATWENKDGDNLATFSPTIAEAVPAQEIAFTCEECAGITWVTVAPRRAGGAS